MEAPFLLPLYVFFVLAAALLYLIGAFILGVIGAALTLPVLYYTGYGLLPPQLTSAHRNVDLPVAIPVHLGVGGLLAVLSLIATVFTNQAIPRLVRYRFARLSPRLETVPKLGLATGLILVLWVGYLLYAREEFAGETQEEQETALLASIIAAIIFCICVLSIAVLSTATLYV
jgi:hypothetical protein